MRDGFISKNGTVRLFMFLVMDREMLASKPFFQHVDPESEPRRKCWFTGIAEAGDLPATVARKPHHNILVKSITRRIC